MHELLLYGQVSPARHQLVVSALAGLTAMQPQPLVERHLIYRPHRDPGTAMDRTTAKKATELGFLPVFINDTFYAYAVGNLATQPRSIATAAPAETGAAAEAGDDDGGGGGGDIGSSSAMVADGGVVQQEEAQRVAGEAQVTDFDRFTWKVELQEIPAVPGKADAATRRAMVNIPVTGGTSPIRLLQDLGYKFVAEYMLQGHRFTYGNIDLRLFQGFGVPAVPGSASGEPIESVSFDPRSLLGGQQPALEQPAPLQIVDPSGTYMLQARLLVGDDSNPEIMSAGLAEMGAARETLRGFIDLELGDRLAMNTRIR